MLNTVKMNTLNPKALNFKGTGSENIQKKTDKTINEFFDAETPADYKKIANDLENNSVLFGEFIEQVPIQAEEKEIPGKELAERLYLVAEHSDDQNANSLLKTAVEVLIPHLKAELPGDYPKRVFS